MLKRRDSPLLTPPSGSMLKWLFGSSRKPSFPLVIVTAASLVLYAMVSTMWVTTQSSLSFDSQAMIRKGSASSFPNENWPKVIHWTARDPTHFQPREQMCLDSCKKLNSDHSFQISTDAEVRAYVAKNFPQFIDMFDNLENQIMRTDLWRYLVLYHDGGLYLDTDVICMKPVTEWTTRFGQESANVKVIVGLEMARADNDMLRFCQWTMYAQPGHRIFLRTVEIIQEILEHRRLHNITTGNAIDITGPVPFTQAIEEEMQRNNVSREELYRGGSHVVGDIGVLGVNGFAPFQLHSHATLWPNHPDIMVIHGFFGRWKPNDIRRNLKRVLLGWALRFHMAFNVR